MSVAGWIYSITFIICGIPQAVKCYQQGHGHGLSHLHLWSLFVGEVAGIAYGLELMELPLLLNCGVNFFILLVILRYRYFPRKA